MKTVGLNIFKKNLGAIPLANWPRLFFISVNNEVNNYFLTEPPQAQYFLHKNILYFR